MDEILKSLINVRSTLDVVEVKGRRNLSHILGCINALDVVISRLMEGKDNEAENQHGTNVPG